MSLADYKAEAKAKIESVMCSGACDHITSMMKMLTIFKDDSTQKAAGAAIIDTFQAACDGYKADIDAAADEAAVDAIMGSVVYPTV